MAREADVCPFLVSIARENRQDNGDHARRVNVSTRRLGKDARTKVGDDALLEWSPCILAKLRQLRLRGGLKTGKYWGTPRMPSIVPCRGDLPISEAKT